MKTPKRVPRRIAIPTSRKHWAVYSSTGQCVIAIAPSPADAMQLAAVFPGFSPLRVEPAR